MDVIFDTNIYTRQSALFTVRNWSSGSAFLRIVFWRTEDEKACELWYALPMSDTSFTVNLIDVFRALLAEGVNFFEMDYETYGEDKVTIYDTGYKIWQYAGTINPSKVLRPRVSLKQTAGSNGLGIENINVCAPSCMLRGEALSRVIMEMWTNNPNLDGEYYFFGQESCSQDFDYAPTTKNFEIPEAAEDWNDTHVDDGSCENEHITIGLFGGATFVFSMQPQEGCKQYAAVEWVSSFGVLRRHIFEVIKQTGNANDVVSLETVGNDWNEHKGQLCGCALRLESLSRYDYWYYADLILSDKAKITFDGSNWYTLQVTAKGYTLPDGNDSGKLNTLEIPVNYCKYDTI